MSARLVVLSGTAQLNILVGNVSSYESTIFNHLTNAGFSIAAVRVVKNTLFTNQINLTIESYVNAEFSAEQQRQGIVNSLSNVRGESWAYWDSPLLSNVNLHILSDGQANTIGQDTTQSDALQNIINGIGHIAGNTVHDATVGAASNISTPIMIGVVAIAALFLFKGYAPAPRYSRY